MKRIFLIFLCLTILGTLCACRVRLIADPAQADTILQEQQEAQPPQEEEPQPVHPETEAAPAVEEAFGENKKTGPVKADRKSRREKKRQQKQAKQEMAEMQDDPSGAQPQEAQVKHTPQPTGNAAQPAPKKTKKKADINMIDL